MGQRERRAAAEGLSQGAVQSGGSYTHWTRCSGDRDGERGALIEDVTDVSFLF